MEKFNLFQSVLRRTNTHNWYNVPILSVCSACFNARAGSVAPSKAE